MKKINLIAIIVLLISCSKNLDYVELKDNILYKDSKNNIYIKHSINIINNNPKKASSNIIFFDDVLYRDKVLKLKQFIDTATFKKSLRKDMIKDVFIKDIYQDKKYIYIFRDHPASYPNIWVSDK